MEDKKIIKIDLIIEDDHIDVSGDMEAERVEFVPEDLVVEKMENDKD